MIKSVAVLVLLEGRSQCFGQFLFSVIEFFLKFCTKIGLRNLTQSSSFVEVDPPNDTAPALSAALSTAQEMLRIA